MLPSLLIAFLVTPAPSVREEASKLVQEERYEEAIELCHDEYERTGDVDFLYCEAQAERWRGHCDRALELYTRVLAETEDADMKKNVHDNIETCAEQLKQLETAPEPGPEPEPPPPVVATPEPQPTAPRPVDRPAPWWRDPAGGALVGIGAVAVATGGGLLVGGAARRRGAEAADDEAAFVDGHAFARRLTIAGAVVTGIGAALMVGGIIRYAIVARGHRRAPGLVIRF